MALAAVLLWVLATPLAALGAVASLVAGVVLFPLLLPWLPTRQFSSKGFILGGVVAATFAILAFVQETDVALWRRLGWALAYLLAMPPVTAFLALNFTGATTFTSKTGVRREMNTYIPAMAWTFGLGTALTLASVIAQMIGS